MTSNFTPARSSSSRRRGEEEARIRRMAAHAPELPPDQASSQKQALKQWFAFPQESVLLPPTMPAFTANSDYEENDSDPIRLEEGDEISVGPADRVWPGWVWATDKDDHDGYVPEDILEPLGEGRFAAMEAFDPTVLTIRRGDKLESLRQIHGWHWCRNEAGKEGWVAGYLLRPV